MGVKEVQEVQSETKGRTLAWRDSKVRQEPVCTLEIRNTATGWMMGAI